MKTYTISAKEGMKLLTDCAIWFLVECKGIGDNKSGTIDIMLIIRWLAGRCKAPTLSANVKLEATANFLTKYFSIEKGFKI